MGIDQVAGTENPVQRDVDANGNDISNVGALDTEDATIKNNQSVSVDIGHNYLGSVVTDDGTYYALRPSDDENDLVLDKTTSPLAPDSWSEVNRWGGQAPGQNNGHGMYVTSQGSILLGVNGDILRSTDGETFTTVHSYGGGGSLWGISEAGSGQILANDYSGDNVALFESTDDGQTWSLLADETDFAYSDHIHQVDIHPANDNILVTGGDGENLIYRSEDGGQTWDEFDALLAQYVAVCPHPTDGSVWFLGHDSGTVGSNNNAPRGIVKVTDGGGSNLSQELVANYNIRGKDVTMGAFGISAIYDENEDSGYLITDRHDVENESLFLYASDSLDGTNWSAVGEVDEYASDVTVQQGPYTTVDAGGEAVIASNLAVNLDTASDPLYGRSPASIPYDNYNTGNTVVQQFNNMGDKESLSVYYEGGGTYMFRDANTRFFAVNRSAGRPEAYATFQIREDLHFNSRDDLTSLTGDWGGGNFRIHDGNDGNPAGPYWWDDDNSLWRAFWDRTLTIDPNA